MLLRLISVILFLTLSLSAFAQQKDKDRVKSKPDTVSLRARRAAIYSTLLPGLGQAYNHRYWKIPIIYAGLGTCAVLAVNNHKEYKKSLSLVGSTPNTDPNYQLYVFDRDYYQRQFQLFTLIGIGVYALNILDAYVDAHLREFDISPDLALSVSPLFYTNFNAEIVSGISLKFKFRHENRIDWIRQNGQGY